jgi:predicted glycosyltransferase
MKILIDIAHPANVHYFKNLIVKFQNDGHELFITAKDKDLVYQLLDTYGFKYYKLGNSANSIISRLNFLFVASFKMLLFFKKYKPDIAISFGTFYCAFAAYFTGTLFFAFDDTEHAKLNRKFYLLIAKKVFTPDSFLINLGKKHHTFKGFMELFYLHPSIFHPQNHVLKKLGVKKNEKYAIIRFISWDAFHDVNKRGLSGSYKNSIMALVEKHMKVFVSIEGDIPPEFERYRLHTNPKDIHSVLYYSNIYIGEGATTASECTMLGVPAIYINSLSAGSLKRQEEVGLLWHLKNDNMLIENIERLISNKSLKSDVTKRKNLFLKTMINPTDYFYEYFTAVLKD